LVLSGGLIITVASCLYLRVHLTRATWAQRLVAERTAELLTANGELAKEVAERQEAEAQLRMAQEQVVETAHRAGMADVASEVLHNVGNILNSINVSTTQMTEIISESRVTSLERVTQMLNEHREDLATFLTQDAKGRHIPVFLTEASRLMKEEEDRMVQMLEGLAKNVRHIKDTISMQQSYAKVSGVEERTALIEVIEDAIEINRAGLDRHGTRLVYEFEELPPVYTNKQKLLQILVNLVNNGKYALSHSQQADKTMQVRLYKQDEDRFRIQVADNGMGIDPKHRDKMFQHGFTTKKDGHGFGLHSSALAAEEMGGSLSVHSDGLGKGATFTLELPFKQAEATTCKTNAI
jgi:C4-dicarboxylate-specific signal transduction histidine kinase